MQERVDEVLAQRAHMEGGAGAGIALSIAGHALFAAFAVWTAIHHPAAQTVNTLTIRFAPTSPMQPARQPAKTPVLREPRPVVETPPKPQTHTVPPPKNTAPPSPFGRSNKLPANIAPPPPAPAAPAVAHPDIAVGTSGVTGLEGGDFPYPAYIENMKRLIGTKWFRPQVADGAGTTVYFAINRDGSVRDARNETASGNGSFDRAALRAILESSPLPPLPFAYNGTYLGVHLTFK